MGKVGKFKYSKNSRSAIYFISFVDLSLPIGYFDTTVGLDAMWFSGVSVEIYSGPYRRIFLNSHVILTAGALQVGDYNLRCPWPLTLPDYFIRRTLRDFTVCPKQVEERERIGEERRDDSRVEKNNTVLKVR